MDFDLDAFYRERDARMAQMDEDLDEYRKRIARHLSQTSLAANNNLLGQDIGVKRAERRSKVPLLRKYDPEPHNNLANIEDFECQPQSQFQSQPTGHGSPDPSMEERPCVKERTSFRDSRSESDVSQLDRELVNNAMDDKNACEVRKFHASKRIANKRTANSIRAASEVKRQKTLEGEILQERLPFHSRFPASNISFQRNLSEPTTSHVENERSLETEQISEIKEFTPSPERSAQPKVPAQPSMSPTRISSFSQTQSSEQPGFVDEEVRNEIWGLPKDKNPIRHGTNEPTTSPIEDASVSAIRGLSPPASSVSDGKGIIAVGSSRLCVQVKERVAKHAAMKRRDKVIPDGPKSKGSEKHVTLVPTAKDIFSALSPHPTLPISRISADKHPEESRNSRKSKERTKAQISKSGQKEKNPLLPPAEYALYLRERSAPASECKNGTMHFLEGKSIIYVGGDMKYASERTRKRMELIVKYGGNLVPYYDPAIVTHIVTDVKKNPTLRALGCKRLSEIPDHIPIVVWNWIADAIGRRTRLDKEDIQAKLEEVWLYAALGERIDTAANGKNPVMSDREYDDTRNKNSASDGENRISSEALKAKVSIARLQHVGSLNLKSASSHDRISAPSLDISNNPTAQSHTVMDTKNSVVDPLEEFYAKAKAAHDVSLSHSGMGDDTDEESDDANEETTSPTILPEKRKWEWTCDRKAPQPVKCVNQDIIDKLQELQELHRAKVGEEDHWRVFSYNKSIRAIRNYPKRIQTYEQALSIRGVGDKTAWKIREIIETGQLRRIDFERTDDIKITKMFQKIYGVGQLTAFKWYSAGCRTLDDLRNQKGGVRLNAAQLIGLQFYDDINSRMPRSEAKAIFDLIRPLALSLDNRLFIEIMGSYRRGKADCGDIDILITRPIDDGRTHSGILSQLLPTLREAGILTEDLAIPENMDDLECVYRGLCRLPQPGSRRRRIDFLTVPWQSRGAALLYYTGDDIFNRAMRMKANKMGYSLNQRGLFDAVIRDPKDRTKKLNQGMLVASETEEEIFHLLNVPWQEPHERVRG